MKLKKIFFLAALMTAGGTTYAQYASDALRFSQFEQGATSRFKAMAGAQTALGGDLSSLASNPAGLGMFTKTEFNLSTGFSQNNIESSYLNENFTAKKDKAAIDQAGVVFYIPTSRAKGKDLKTGWLSLNYGVAYNRTNNFNSTIDYSGNNLKSSIADYFADLASSSSTLANGSLEKMAFDNFLIENDPASGYFPTTALNNQQQNIVQRSGSQSEVNFSAGANYSNQLYVGASISLSSLKFNSDREFLEAGKNQTYVGQSPDFTGGTYNLSYQSNQTTKGSGVNAKFGMIYRANDILRVGLGFISPTWFQVDDNYSETLSTSYRRANGSAIAPYTNPDEIYDFSYTLRTPFRVNGGLALVVNKMGLISGDAEYVDYASINFSSSDRETDQDNNKAIRELYKSTLNLRIGGEYKFESVMLRAGYSHAGSPYQNSEDRSTNIITGGIGYRTKLLYIDLAYQNKTFNGQNTPYTISTTYPDYATTGPGESASLKIRSNQVFLTLGTRF